MGFFSNEKWPNLAVRSEASFQCSLAWKDCFLGRLSPAPASIRGAAGNYSAWINSVSHKLAAWIPLVRTTLTLSTKSILSMQDLAVKRNKGLCCQLQVSWRMANFRFVQCHLPFLWNFLVDYENDFRSLPYCLTQRQLWKKSRNQRLFSKAHILVNPKNITFEILLGFSRSNDGKDKNVSRVIYSL